MEGNCEKSVNNDGPEVKLKGRALLIYDLKQRRLIPTKILFFVVLSSKSLTICFNFFVLCHRDLVEYEIGVNSELKAQKK
jgi:hypothetical protein